MSLYLINVVRLPERFAEKKAIITNKLQAYFKDEGGIMATDTVKCMGEKSLHDYVDSFIEITDKSIKENHCEEEYISVHEDGIVSMSGMPSRKIDLYKKSDLAKLDAIKKILSETNE
jgi:hypothetical protein